MKRSEYCRTRALVRANGFAALRWMTGPQADVHRALYLIASATDWLSLRSRWMARPDTSRANIIRITSFLEEA